MPWTCISWLGAPCIQLSSFPLPGGWQQCLACTLLSAGVPGSPRSSPLSCAAFQASFISCAPAPAAPSAAPCPRGGAGTRPGPGACPRPRLRAPGGSALQERGGSAAPRRCRAPSSGGTPTTDVLMYET